MLRLPRNYNAESYLEIRLDEWAKFYSRGNKIDLDNTHINIIHRLRECGFTEVQFVGHMPEAANHSAEEVEGWVKDMNNEYPDYADALRFKYLARVTYGDKKRVMQKIAEKQSIHYRTFESQGTTCEAHFDW
jgi:hypothetical protein